MSLFNPNIIQDESDIEAHRKKEAYYNAILDAAHEINKKGKKAPAYYIMCNEETAEVFVRQYPNS